MIAPKDPLSNGYCMPKAPNTQLRDLLKSNQAKTHKLSEASEIGGNRLAQLNAMLDELRRQQKVINTEGLKLWLLQLIKGTT